jgi:hypothetical protein
MTQLRCCKIATGCPVATDQMRTVRSQLVAISRPSGVNEIARTIPV